MRDWFDTIVEFCSRGIISKYQDFYSLPIEDFFFLRNAIDRKIFNDIQEKKAFKGVEASDSPPCQVEKAINREILKKL